MTKQKNTAILFVLLLVVVLVDLRDALAQTTATLREKSVGATDCSNGASAADFDTLVQCTSTTSTMGTMQKAPVFFGQVTAPPYASTSCDTAKTGMIQYTSTYGVQGCVGGVWTALSQSATPGAVMPDGTIYAGSGIYTTPCDIGQSGTQGSCTGTRATTAWATTVAACQGLVAYGHSDWYLPTWDQLYTIYLTSATAVGGFMQTSAVSYQSSTLVYGFYDSIMQFYAGAFGQGGLATTTSYARCVRR